MPDTQDMRMDLEKLAPEVREELLVRVGWVIATRVMRRVWHTLDFRTQNELMTLLETSDSERGDDGMGDSVFAFLAHCVPDLDRYVREEATALRHMYEEVCAEVVV